MSRYYRMDGTLYKNVQEWAHDFEMMDRKVGKTKLPSGVLVSTVWLGLDCQLCEGPPLIFETMVFSAAGEVFASERYSTLEEARSGHNAMAEKWQVK